MSFLISYIYVTKQTCMTSPNARMFTGIELFFSFLKPLSYGQSAVPYCTDRPGALDNLLGMLIGTEIDCVLISPCEEGFPTRNRYGRRCGNRANTGVFLSGTTDTIRETISLLGTLVASVQVATLKFLRRADIDNDSVYFP